MAKTTRIAFILIGAFLLFSGSVRLLNAAGSSQALLLPEPMIEIPLRYALLIVGALELLVGAISIFSRRTGLQAACLTWMGANELLYSLGLYWMNVHPRCTAIGNPLDPLQLPGFLTILLERHLGIALIVAGLLTTAIHWFSCRREQRKKRHITTHSPIETPFAPLLALAALLSAGTLASASPGYETRGIEIQGTIHKVSTNKNTGRVTEGSHSFKVSVWQDRWLIENTFASGVQSRTFFDGTNIQATLKSTNAPPPGISSKVSALGFAVAPSSVAASNLTISVRPSTGFPFSRADVNIPWLAYCSGTYLQQPGRVLPPLVSDYSFMAVSHAYADVTRQFQDNIGLPRETQIFLKSSAGNGQHSSSEPLFIYHVETFTNVAGVNLPLRFHYGQNEPGPGYSYSGTGTVDSITISTNTLSDLLDQRYQQTIVDFRFRSPEKGISSIVYRTTNSTLVATNDPVLLQKLSQTRENPIQSEKRRLPRRVAISALIFMSLLSGFLITILHFKSKRPTE